MFNAIIIDARLLGRAAEAEVVHGAARAPSPSGTGAGDGES